MTSQLAHGGILPVHGYDVANETDFAIRQCEALDHGLFDGWVFQEEKLDLGHFDAVSSYFYLRVDSSKMEEATFW